MLRGSAVALAAATMLVACGGSGNDTSVKTATSTVYVMGDSLADSGSMGFKFTTQTSDASGAPILSGAQSTRLWVDYVADNATVGKQPMLCSYFTIEPATGSTSTNAACTNYAVGGALIGPTSTTPSVVRQMQAAAAQAAAQGGFKSDALILVDGGANDMAGLLTQLATFRAASTGASTSLSTLETAATLPGAATAADMQTAYTRSAATLQSLAQALSAQSTAVSGLITYIDSVLGEGKTQTYLPAANAESVQAALAQLQTLLQEGAQALGMGDVGTAQTRLSAVATGARQLSGALAANATATSEAAGKVGLAFGQALARMQAKAVTTHLLGHGAKRVVVLNLPAIETTPRMKPTLDAAPSTKALLLAVMQAFNSELEKQFANVSEVLCIDFYTEFAQQVATPAPYGLGNVTDAVCDTSASSSAATFAQCTLPARAAALGLSQDALRNTFYPTNAYDASKAYYTFSDPFHPTAVAHQRISQLVAREMAKRGWM